MISPAGVANRRTRRHILSATINYQSQILDELSDARILIAVQQ